jgi:hypothetical protein
MVSGVDSRWVKRDVLLHVFILLLVFIHVFRLALVPAQSSCVIDCQVPKLRICGAMHSAPSSVFMVWCVSTRTTYTD